MKVLLACLCLIGYLLSSAGCVPSLPTTGSVDAQKDALQLVDRGTEHLRSGRLDEARAAFEVARDLYPLASATDGLGCVAFLEGNLTGAEALYLEAYEMDRNYDNPLSNLALLYESMGEPTKAEMYYGLALAAEPDNIRARNNYAVFLRAKGKETDLVLKELLRAAAVEEHPIVMKNIQGMH